MKLHELNVPKGAKVKSSKRRGRGSATGQGGTAGRGHKGQNSRSGGGVRRGFEGGQMPLIRRVPKRGFYNKFSESYEVVNLRDIAAREFDGEVTPESLKKVGLIHNADAKIKILGDGELAKGLTIKAHAFSRSAKEKIANAGGTAKEL